MEHKNRRVAWPQAVVLVGVLGIGLAGGYLLAKVASSPDAKQSQELAADAPAPTPTVMPTAAPNVAPTTTPQPTSLPTPTPTPTPTPVCAYTNPDEPVDDPNPDYDGSRGRYPVSSNPIPPGYPTPQTTGICGVGLTPADLVERPGVTVVTEDGTVLDGLDLLEGVRVQANNVTIRNSRITSTGLTAVRLDAGYTNLLIEDSRIRAVGEFTTAAVYFYGPGVTLRRVHISGGQDGLKATEGNLLVEDSYYAGSYRVDGSDGPGSGTHNDVVQIFRGENITFRNNSLLGPWNMSTSVFLFQTSDRIGGPINNLRIEDNYLSGGGYTIYTRQEEHPLTDTQITGNQLELDSWLNGPWSNSAGDGVLYSGNDEIAS